MSLCLTMKENFDNWLGQFKPVIASFDYYVDFDKVYENAEKWRAELYLMNSLLGSESIEKDFIGLAKKYPTILETIPILIAVRAQEIPILNVEGLTYYQFGNTNGALIPNILISCVRLDYLSLWRLIE